MRKSIQSGGLCFARLRAMFHRYIEHLLLPEDQVHLSGELMGRLCSWRGLEGAHLAGVACARRRQLWNCLLALPISGAALPLSLNDLRADRHVCSRLMFCRSLACAGRAGTIRPAPQSAFCRDVTVSPSSRQRCGRRQFTACAALEHSGSENPRSYSSPPTSSWQRQPGAPVRWQS